MAGRHEWGGDVRVLAIDAAPGKPSTVFDGKYFKDRSGYELREYLDHLANRAKKLVCWDAPLTGPANPSTAGTSPGDFTQRLIEKFFSRTETGFKTPKGISVRPYGGCPHWTISRSILGLPRTGPYDQSYSHLPFHLLPPAEARDYSRARLDSEYGGQASIIEIHPGVAAWLWCMGDYDGPWEYKRRNARGRRILDNMWQVLLKNAPFSWRGRPTPENDDEFDVAVGYILGSLYVGNRTRPRPSNVIVLGNRSTGSFLLPEVPDLVRSWCDWLKSRRPRHKP